MNKTPSAFEALSDELLINIFGYLNTLDLFQSFYNLNFRFNAIIQSLNNLHLIIPENNHSFDIELFSPYIYSVVIIGDVDLNLHHFKNLRRLILNRPTTKLLRQLDDNSLPYLEYLSIPDVLFGMSPVYEKIFSNTFPRLKSSDFHGFETIETIQTWTQTPSLRILKIGLIDFHVYKAILSACPNLSVLKLHMFQSYLKLSDIHEHFNLRQLEIHSEITDWHYSDQLIDSFLRCVPHLEQLSINRTISVSKLMELIPDYDWLASIIALRLPLLQYLSFSLHLEYHSELIQILSMETHRQLRKYFSNAHQNRYQARFIIK